MTKNKKSEEDVYKNLGTLHAVDTDEMSDEEIYEQYGPRTSELSDEELHTEYLQHIYSEYQRWDKKEDLIKYLEQGGVITDEIRTLMVDLLRRSKRKTTGRPVNREEQHYLLSLVNFEKGDAYHEDGTELSDRAALINIIKNGRSDLTELEVHQELATLQKQLNAARKNSPG